MRTSGTPPISRDQGRRPGFRSYSLDRKRMAIAVHACYSAGGFPERVVLVQFDLVREKLAMSFRDLLVGAVIAATATLAGCSSGPTPKTAAGIDSQYGIPVGSVPADLLRPDGSMKNGLLPAQPNDTGG
jgi:hypothetical protein